MSEGIKMALYIVSMEELVEYSVNKGLTSEAAAQINFAVRSCDSKHVIVNMRTMQLEHKERLITDRGY